MRIEFAIFAGTLIALLLLAVSLWRASLPRAAEFFPSQRARALSAVRLRAGVLAGVALAALSVQFMLGWQLQQSLEQKEQRLLAYESELLQLRVDYQLARSKLRAQTLAVAAPEPAPAPEQAEVQESKAELAQIAVPRAVVRDRPAGRPQFVLTSGARVQLRGAPADDSGRAWREAQTADGRQGWIAAEVLRAVEG